MLISNNKAITKHRMLIWHKLPHGFYLSLSVAVGCLAVAFVLREWGKELALSAVLFSIMLYMAKDILDKR